MEARAKQTKKILRKINIVVQLNAAKNENDKLQNP